MRNRDLFRQYLLIEQYYWCIYKEPAPYASRWYRLTLTAITVHLKHEQKVVISYYSSSISSIFACNHKPELVKRLAADSVNILFCPQIV